MITKKNYTISVWEKKDIAWLILGMILIGMFIGVCISCVVVINTAYADELTYDCWAMCQPGSEVMIREKPDRNGAVVGAVTCGTRMETDWQEKGEWIHLVGVSNETGEGWIHKGYVVFDEPYHIEAEGVITGKGRVACRKAIEGKRKGWVNAGSSVTVYWISQEWAVTDRGFISCDYLEVP